MVNSFATIKALPLNEQFCTSAFITQFCLLLILFVVPFYSCISFDPSSHPHPGELTTLLLFSTLPLAVEVAFLSMEWSTVLPQLKHCHWMNGFEALFSPFFSCISSDSIPPPSKWINYFCFQLCHLRLKFTHKTRQLITRPTNCHLYWLLNYKQWQS